MLSAEPMTLGPQVLAEAKAYLRVSGSDEDALIGRLLLAAASLCEQFTRSSLTARAMSEVLPASGAWTRLGTAPVTAVVAVEDLPREGAPAAMAAEEFAIDIDAAGEGWVRLLRRREAPRIRVAYQAGLAADWASLPDALRQGIVRLAAHLYVHRDAASDAGPPAAVAALWRPWRRMRLG